MEASSGNERGATVNLTLAANLRELADILEQQDADGFRVTAYRRAARTLASSDTPVDDVARHEGIEGLIALPGIGRSIAGAIMEMLETGRWAQLDRVRGSAEPENLFQTIPGIGPELARRIHDELHLETLEALELAAHDGRLETVEGMGRRRSAIVRAALGERLGRRRVRTHASSIPPPLQMLLSVDQEYREEEAAGRLRKIAPKRFNPTGTAWLPVLHARRDEWHFTALFSNTHRAHELGKTDDWVVIYYYTDDSPEGQCTVVTETHGPLEGRRVVRGREDEYLKLHTL